MSAELFYLSATEAIALFRSGLLSPVELMCAVIDRAESVEPVVNALCFKYFEQALEQARDAEKAYAAGTARPLEGIPLAIKDEANIDGFPVSNGSLLMRDYVADHTDPMAERLLSAGAIMHARTTTPEFSGHFCTHSKLWGVTRNPWNPEFSVGGSSGGSGAALAAGTTTLASGSDIGGSIRAPASQNAVVGFKPPYGRVPQHPPFNLDVYCHEGPLARTVADCILFENVIAGPHPVDIASLRPKLEIPSRFDGIEGMRIAFSPDLDFIEVDADVRANTLEALDTLRGLGASVEEVTLGWTEDCLRAAKIHLGFSMGSLLKRDFGDESLRDQVMPYIRHFFDMSKTVSADDVMWANDQLNTMYQSLSLVFADQDLLVCPTMAIASVKADYDYGLHELRINGKEVEPLLGCAMTYPFNSLSRCPVMSMPSGRDSNGVPTGIQMVGRSYDDITVFRVAAAYESAREPLYRSGTVPSF